MLETRESSDDLALMRRVASSNERAVEELYDRYGALVYRMAIQTCRSPAEAEDAVQEVFIRLWRTAKRFDPNRAALTTWVMLLTRRCLVDRLRRARARVSPGPLEESWSASERMAPQDAEIEREERVDRLIEQIERLPQLQRDVVTRAYFGGQTLRQIGMELDKPLGTVKSTLSRALVRLRERAVHEESAS